MDSCSNIQETDVRELLKRIREYDEGVKIPFYGSFEVTNRCNLKCVHCYVKNQSDKSDYDFERKNELTFVEICKIIDQAEEEGVLAMLLTGGEPFMRNDFLEIISYIRKKGIFVQIFTNGTLINKRVADFLEEVGISNIEISLLGITEDTYESISGVKGSFKRCLNAIDLLLERNLPLEIKTPMLSLNRHEMKSLHQFANSKGILFRFDSMVLPRYDGSNEVCRFRVDPVDAVSKFEFDDTRMNKMYSEWYNPRESSRRRSFLFSCNATASFHINPYGFLQYCTMMPSNINLRDCSFRDEWYKLYESIQSMKHSNSYTCAKCEIYEYCTQCPAVAKLETGDYEKPSEFVCIINKTRHKVFCKSKLS